MIFVECYADHTLVKFLTGRRKREIVHDIKGRSGVLGQLEQHHHCKALVDEDPKSVQHSYMVRAALAQEISSLDLGVLRDQSRNNDIIILCPALEQWILKTAALAHINVTDRRYNLPDNPIRLHGEISRRSRKALNRYARLLADLKDTPRLSALARLLQG